MDAIPPSGCTIGDAARRSGVSAKMIRYYESVGLLPAPPRSAANDRRFDGGDLRRLRRLRFIRRARLLGFPLAEITTLLQLSEAPARASEAVKRVAEARVAELDARIAALVGMRDAVAALAASCPGDAGPACTILDALEGDADDG